MSTVDLGRGINSTNALTSVVSRSHRAAAPHTRFLNQALFVFADFAFAWASAMGVLWFRHGGGAMSYGNALARNAQFLFLFSILVLLFCQTQKLYRGVQTRPALHETLAVCKAVLFATLVLAATIYLSGAKVVSRVAVGYTVVVTTITLVGWRQCRRQYVSKRVAVGHDCCNVLIFGCGDTARLLERHLRANKQLGYVVKSFIERRRVATEHREAERRRTAFSNVIEQKDELRDVIRAQFIDEVFVTLPEDREVVKEVVAQAREFGISVRMIPDMYDGLGLGAPIDYLGPFPTVQLHEEHIPELALIFKRTIDVIGSMFALTVTAPLWLLIAIAIRLDSSGPILYRSARVGKKARIFTCLKFRTMVRNADQLRENLLHLNERDGLLFKVSSDPRITRVGRFLRKYSLDEIPQFLNVLKGDMSLVGPRPPIPGEVARYELDHLKRLEVTPGITGLWQVEARRDPSFESYINLDSQYVDHWTIWLDVRILLKTVAVVFAGTGQ